MTHIDIHMLHANQPVLSQATYWTMPELRHDINGAGMGDGDGDGMGMGVLLMLLMNGSWGWR